MSSTNKTTYYELPQFVDNDIFNPLVDDNDAYSKIDTALHNIANSEADNTSEIVGIKSRLDGAEGDIDTLKAQNGDSVLTTEAQTLSGAVNELNADTSALDGRLDIVEDDINNVSTGLKVKVNTLEVQNGNNPLDTTAQTLSGAINELAKLKVIKTPQMYGAVADGVADDSDAIQDAIDAVNTAGGGIVFFPTGVYCIAKGINLTGKSKVYLVGSGIDASVIKWIGGTTATILSKDVDVKHDFSTFGVGTESMLFVNDYLENQIIGIESLTFDGDTKVSCGMWIKWVHFNSYIKNCKVNNCVNAGIVTDRCWCFNIIETTFNSCLIGIATLSGSNDYTINECEFFGCEYGIEVVSDTSSTGGTSGVRIFENIFENNIIPIMLTCDDSRMFSIKIEMNYFEDNACAVYFRNFDMTKDIRSTSFNENECVVNTSKTFIKNNAEVTAIGYLCTENANVFGLFVNGNCFKTGGLNIVNFNSNSYTVLVSVVDNDTPNYQTTPAFDVIPETGFVRRSNAIFTPINLAWNQVENVALTYRNTPPSNPVNGALYYNNITSDLAIWDGYTWNSANAKGLKASVKGTALGTGTYTQLIDYHPSGITFVTVGCVIIADNADDVDIRVNYYDPENNLRSITLKTGAISSGITVIDPCFLAVTGLSNKHMLLEGKATNANNVRIYALITPQ